MDLQEILQFVNPEVLAALRRAVELGRWEDGTRLEPAQRELCLQAVIAYEARELPPQERTGYIDRGSKAQGELCDAPSTEPEVVRIVRDRGV